jgi:thiamine biosynthesis protein ThiS
MKLTLNGEEKEVAAETTILDLVQSMGLTPSQVAVERNFDIVPRATYAEVKVQENDKIEVVTFVGGG